MSVFFYTCSFVLFGAISTTDGKWEGYWDSHSVLFGTVNEVQKIANGEYQMVLTVDGSIAGSMTLDPRKTQVIKAQLWTGRLTGAIEKAPAVGTDIVFVLAKKRNGEFFITAGHVFYMPNQTGLMEISSLAELKKVSRSIREYYKEDREKKQALEKTESKKSVKEQKGAKPE